MSENETETSEPVGSTDLLALMKASEFCYWLQGHFEISGTTELTKEQGEMVKRHLALVFKHELDAPDPTGELQQIHDGKPPKRDDIVYRC